MSDLFLGGYTEKNAGAHPGFVSLRINKHGVVRVTLRERYAPATHELDIPFDSLLDLLSSTVDTLNQWNNERAYSAADEEPRCVTPTAIARFYKANSGKATDGICAGRHLFSDTEEVWAEVVVDTTPAGWSLDPYVVCCAEEKEGRTKYYFNSGTKEWSIVPQENK